MAAMPSAAMPASSISPVTSSKASSIVPNSANTGGSNKTARILACVLCQHRKIKCDRHFPCSNCLKANVTCTPSTPAPARKRRRPNQDLQERLARCEELLKEYATAKPPGETPSPKPTPEHIEDLEEPYPKWKSAGKLIKEDGGVRFMDNFLLSTVYDELQSMRKIVDDGDDTTSWDEPAPTEHSTPADNSDLIFGGESPATNIEDLTPNPSHIFRLWQIFLDRCNPLTKIVHIPTLQPFLVEATGSSPNLPKNIEALLFSIYTLATVAMSDQECQECLGISREKALAQFSNGVRLSLTRMSFLQNYDLLTLQALVIYLISLQGRYNRHASWILNGIVIRIAQKMGLHRDGELLGLQPFETEMRRRLWWQIIMVDAKYAILSGLSHTLLPRNWDTKEPTNINDADLLPSATKPYQDKEGPTEMVLVLVTYKIAKFIFNSPGLELVLMLNEMEAMAMKGPGVSDKAKIEEYRSLVRRLEETLDDQLERISSPTAGELHDMAREMKDHILLKLKGLSFPNEVAEDWGTEVFDHTSNTFKLVVSSLEHAVVQYKTMNHPGFNWYVRLHFQLDLFGYMVGQLCHRTSGRLVDKAWQVIEDVYWFHPEFLNTSLKLYYHLGIFVFKAWKKREEVLRARLGHAPDTPKCILQLRELMPGHDDAKSEKTPSEFGYATRSQPEVHSAVDANSNGAAPFDQFVGNYHLDFSAIDFDMWGNSVPGGTQLQQMFPFGMGPQPEW